MRADSENFFVIDSACLEQAQNRFYGFGAREDGSLLLQGEYSPVEGDALSGSGAWVSVCVSANKIVITQDANGSYGLCIYRDGDYFAISNSFMQLVEYLKDKHCMSINRDCLDAHFVGDLVSLSATETLISEIAKLPRNAKVTIDIKSHKLVCECVPLQERCISLDSREGIDVLDKWYAKWVNVIRDIKRKTNNLTMELSGGFDTRMTLALFLNSGIDLNSIHVYSINNNLHTHAEDYEIAQELARAYGFKLNDTSHMCADAVTMSKQEQIENSFNVKLGFNKQILYQTSKFVDKSYVVSGDGGAVLRDWKYFTPEEYEDSVSKGMRKKSPATYLKVSAGLLRLLKRAIERQKKAYGFKDDSPHIIHSLVRDARVPNHVGHGAVERFLANRITLAPLLDPDLDKLAATTADCADRDLLITMIIARYRKDLFAFKIDSNRSFNKNTIAYAESLNKKYGEWVKPRQEMISGVDMKAPASVPASDKRITWDDINGEIKEEFVSQGFRKTIENLVDKNVYEYALADSATRKYHPMSYIIPLYAAGQLAKMISAYDSPISVSVIMPVYNVEAYLRTSLDSVLGQTLDRIEVICVDDGSTDGSMSILNEYATRDKRIIILRQENQGAGVARNRALDIARGEWVAFLDPDDCYPSQETLAHLVSAAKKNFVDICGGSLRTINTKGEIVPKKHSGDNAGYVFQADELREYKTYQFEYGYWRFIYRRTFLDRNKLRFPEVRRFQDPPFMVAAFTAAGRFYSLQEDTYCYREGEGFKNVDWKADDFLRARHYLKGLYQVLSIAKREKYDELLARTYRRMFKGGGKFLWTYEYFSYLKPEISAVLDDFVPKVSIIIPVYNDEKFVGETLDSVLLQTYPNLEVICVNDGSTDGSLAVVESYSSKFSGIRTLRILSQKNGGLSAARNTGMNSATGKYIYFLDSDDKIYPYSISELASLAEKENLDQVIFSSDVFIDGDNPDLVKQAKGFRSYYEIPSTACGRVLSGAVMFDTLTSLGKFHCSQPLRFYRRSVLEDHKCRFPLGLLHEDNYFAPLSLRFAQRVLAINKRFYQRRVRGGSIMTAKTNDLPKLHGMVGVCLALIQDEVLWNGDAAYICGLRRHLLSLSRGAGWHCSSDDVASYARALDDLVVSKDAKQLLLEFVVPILRDRAAEIVRANKNARLYKQAQTSLESLKAELDVCRKGAKDCQQDSQQEVAEYKNKQKALQHSLAVTRKEVDALHHSQAYQVGMFVTWPARKAWGGVKCLRENGVKYTLKHAVGKILRKCGSKVKW